MFINLFHLADGKGQYLYHVVDVFNLIQCQGAPLAGFEVLVEHLIATDSELPYILRHGREISFLVDVKPLFFLGINGLFHLIAAVADVHLRCLGNRF